MRYVPIIIASIMLILFFWQKDLYNFWLMIKYKILNSIYSEQYEEYDDSDSNEEKKSETKLNDSDSKCEKNLEAKDISSNMSSLRKEYNNEQKNMTEKSKIYVSPTTGSSMISNAKNEEKKILNFEPNYANLRILYGKF